MSATLWRGTNPPLGRGTGTCANVCRSARAISDKRMVTEKRRSRSEEHTSELQSLMRISYAVFCLQKKNTVGIIDELPRQGKGGTQCKTDRKKQVLTLHTMQPKL